MCEVIWELHRQQRLEELRFKTEEYHRKVSSTFGTKEFKEAEE